MDTITIDSYIKKEGTAHIANLLGRSKSTVSNWRSLARVPSPESAADLIRISGGLLSWESIYKPFADLRASK